jgi:putative membrane protein
MKYISAILIGLVAVEHLYFLYLEMFVWETKGKQTFKGLIPDEMFTATKKMAANQGLYNGFLSAGLIWSLLISDPIWKCNIALFFLGCVVAAGVYGGLTVSKKIIYVQVLPAVLAILFLLLSCDML